MPKSYPHQDPGAARSKLAWMWPALFLGLALGGYYGYMRYSATGIEANLRYPSAMQTARPDLDKIYVDTNESSLELMSENLSKRPAAERQTILMQAAATQFSVPIGTKVLVLDRHYGGHTARVKILEGPAAGKIGWVYAENVSVPFWSDF